MLVVGRVEPREIRVVGASAAVPSMLSPTGRPAEIISQVDATIEPRDKTIDVRQLSGRVAGVVVTARGTLVLARRGGKPLEETIATFVRDRFPALCRQALEIERYTRQFEQPELHLDLSPSESGAATLSLTLLASAARLEQPIAVRASRLQAHTRLLLFGENPASWLEFSARELDLPGRVRAHGVRGDVYGRFQDGAFVFEPRELTVTADTVDVAGVGMRALSGQVSPRPLPQIDVTAVGRILDAPLAVRASADLKQQSSRASFEGEIAPALLGPLSQRLRVDVRKFFDFTRLIVDRGEVRLGPGWKFEKLEAVTRLDGVDAYGVPMTDGHAVIELDPKRFYSPFAAARVGENFARGTYEQNFETLEYRFLLDGRLRPLAISPWFKDWWSSFFRQFDFQLAPPAASVDVRGTWRDGNRTSVFVFADATRSLIRGAELDRVRTRMFIRPGFFDGLELFTTHGEGFATGRFAFLNSPAAPGWEVFEIAVESSLDLATVTSLLGPDGARTLQPFQVAQPPALKVTGRFTGPGSSQGEHQDLRVEARTSGEFKFHEFPLQDASFVATLQDDEVSIDDFEAFVANGVLGGHARVWGKPDARRLGFDVALNDASLGQLAGTLQGWFARQKGLPPPPLGRFVQEKANVHLNFAASAEGSYSDPFSYRGDGNVSLKGPEIAEIPLLGLLSELLRFTSLRFTEADANFKIEGPKIAFPEVKVRGSNAAIEAHGSYALDRRELDFNAKIFPFQESENIIKTVVGAVLTPLSNAFEVKLAGSLEKPAWAFAIGPTNFLRSLAPGDNSEKSEGNRPATPPEPTPSTPPSGS